MKEINISKNIADLRKQKGITQEQLHQDAVANSQKIMPPEITSMASIMENSMRAEMLMNGCSEDEIDEMKRDESWQETICMNPKLQLFDLDNLFRQFKIERLCNDKKEHPTITEAKQHFNNWLYKKEHRNGNKRNNPIDNIERAQQHAIRESMEFIRQTEERDTQVQDTMPL